MDKKRARRKSPKSATPTKKVTVYLPLDIDTAVYQEAERDGLGISDMMARLLREALAARHPQE